MEIHQYEQNEQQKNHIIMFPFMAQGHLIPFISFAKQISQRYPTFTITIVNTPLNVKNLRSNLNSSTTTTTSFANIQLAELPFSSSDHGLPPNSENTDTLPSHLIAKLFQASQSLQPSFENLMTTIIDEQCRPLCIIADVFFGWTIDVARNLGLPHFSFTTGGAYGTVSYFSIWLNLPLLRAVDAAGEFQVPGFPDTDRFHISQLPLYLRSSDGNDFLCNFFQSQISFSLKSDGMLCNTVEEIETLGLKLLRSFMNEQRIWAIGPLLPPILLGFDSPAAASLRAGKEPGVSPQHCVEWLNGYPPASVLYISFGSQNTIMASQMMELAKGVEASGKPFIWVLRPPREFDIKSEFRNEWLPEGFEERIKERRIGLLVRKWAPQLEILSHRSTGGFLSHCGWNSILESLSQGVPIIGWSLEAEQGYNLKMLGEEMGVCVELARGVEDDIGSDKVKRVIEVVMSNEEGKGEEMRRKANEIATNMRVAMKNDADRKGFSVEAIDDFIRTAMSKTGR